MSTNLLITDRNLSILQSNAHNVLYILALVIFAFWSPMLLTDYTVLLPHSVTFTKTNSSCSSWKQTKRHAGALFKFQQKC